MDAAKIQQALSWVEDKRKKLTRDNKDRLSMVMPIRLADGLKELGGYCQELEGAVRQLTEVNQGLINKLKQYEGEEDESESSDS